MFVVALGVGLLVGNILHPGSGLHLTNALKSAATRRSRTPRRGRRLRARHDPDPLVSSFTDGQVLQTLLVALLVGFALQAMGPAGTPVLRGIGHVQKLVFRVLSMIMWAAADRGVRGDRGGGRLGRRDALKALPRSCSASTWPV